jgi:uncharacterized protein (DUF2267 family)
MSILPDEPTEEERQEELPEDNGTPFRPATDAVGDATDTHTRRRAAGQIDDTHQVTDTNLQPEEIYEEGYAGAAEAQEPNAGNAVVGYDPAQDQRRSRAYEAPATSHAPGRDYTEYIAAVAASDPRLAADAAEEVLQLTTELIALQLTDDERQQVAASLPGRLHDIVLAALPGGTAAEDDIVGAIAETQAVARIEAQRRYTAVWQVLQPDISTTVAARIAAKLPPIS